MSCSNVPGKATQCNMNSKYSNNEPVKLSKSSYTILCHKIIHDVFCVGNGSDKPTSVLCCGYQHGLITRASVTCNM